MSFTGKLFPPAKPPSHNVTT
uniref:Uncharacterized protein n=1 Tax=Rhizophora mucronata TaxID=61149 RepID=A0A2P2QMW7_RHIMU